MNKYLMAKPTMVKLLCTSKMSLAKIKMFKIILTKRPWIINNILKSIMGLLIMVKLLYPLKEILPSKHIMQTFKKI